MAKNRAPTATNITAAASTLAAGEKTSILCKVQKTETIPKAVAQSNRHILWCSIITTHCDGYQHNRHEQQLPGFDAQIEGQQPQQ